MSKQNNITVENEPSAFLGYLNIIRNSLFPIILITLTCLVFAVVYALNAVNIYKSNTVMKVSQPKANILEGPAFPEIRDLASDRFLSNEIEILKSFTLRMRVARAILDSFRVINDESKFNLILRTPSKEDPRTGPKEPEAIATGLKTVDIEQKRGLDLIDISVQSASPFEAALIANIYAKVYESLNLEYNRNQLTVVKSFLKMQRDEKLAELKNSEEIMKTFQEKGGIVLLEQQATSLISQLSNYESQRNLSKVELTALEKSISSYKADLRSKDPSYLAYLENLGSTDFLKSLQAELASLEYQRDLILAKAKQNNTQPTALVKDLDQKIVKVRGILNEKLASYKNGILASSPEEVKQLTQRILEDEIKAQALRASIEQLDKVVSTYETQFNQLPKSSIELARLQRSRESLEKLYLLVEQKYQEALINEQSQPGNVLIIDVARVPRTPSKPNRPLIIVVGLIMGLIIAFGYAFTRNFFDRTIKTPEDIQKRNTNVLAWIPQIEGVANNGVNEFEFIVYKKPDSIPSEAFRALRTRVQFSRLDESAIRTILVTSSAPSEGKTMICTNLAGSFAQSNKSTLVIDCDLRKPRIHSFFRANRYPGLVDHLFGQVSLEEIIRPSEMKNLYYITSGTIPPNPAELLESRRMREFLDMIKEKFDYVLLDSPPVIAVTDSEILSRVADATILVVSANTTELDLMDRALDIIKQDNVNFIGTVLNNFVYKSSYGSYYKYYYYYTRPKKSDKSKLPNPFSN